MKKRALIIDEDPKMRQVVADLCKLGWASLEAKSAAEALKKSIEEKPDFVIMDVSLPDNSKKETAQINQERSADC
jgi:DNA-binding response OmpR family regulator